MLIGVIQKPRLAEMAAVLDTLDASLFDALELRLDACEDLTAEGLARLPLPLPAIFTLRCREEGGAFQGEEAVRLTLLETLIRLKPAYMDIEASVPADRIAAIRALSPTTQIILSRHNFTETPDALEDMLHTMRAQAEGVIYKIATYARNSLDALRMLVFCTQQRAAGIPLVGICMGPDGESTRILAPLVHSGLCYCPVEECSAPGQIDVHSLREIYNVVGMNTDTALYGLLGNPVSHSIGHMHHNRLNASAGGNAVYVKWRLEPEELEQGLALLHTLGVRGLSVTMPLKEAVLPFLCGMNGAVRDIGAANTLIAMPDGWYGLNTDGQGALNCLPVALHGKRVVVLGAGGAAKSVIYEAVRQGAVVRVFNRSAHKRLPGDVPVYPLGEVGRLRNEPYDVIINALPFDAPIAFAEVPFLRGTLAMDCSYAKPGGQIGEFLRRAAEAGCVALDGAGMYVEQAALQRGVWGLPRY